MSQKTVLESLQLLCPTIGLARPQVAFTSTENSIVKLLAFMHEALADLKQEADWQILRREHTLTTSANVEAYDFPSDLDRFISATFYDRTNRWDVPGSLTPSQWQNLKAWQNGFPFSSFTIANNQIKFYPTPSSAITFACEYIVDYVARSSGGDYKTSISEDSDIVLFDHRLVACLVKLKWLTSLGQDTSAAADDYDDRLAAAKSKDSPMPIINAAGGNRSIPVLSTANFPVYSPTS